MRFKEYRDGTAYQSLGYYACSTGLHQCPQYVGRVSAQRVVRGAFKSFSCLLKASPRQADLKVKTVQRQPKSSSQTLLRTYRRAAGHVILHRQLLQRYSCLGSDLPEYEGCGRCSRVADLFGGAQHRSLLLHHLPTFAFVLMAGPLFIKGLCSA